MEKLVYNAQNRGEPMEKVGVLRQIPIFSKLGDEELMTIGDTAIRKKYTKDSIIVHEEDEGNSLMFILSGRVKVVLLSESGKEIILSILGDGDFFGELLFIIAYYKCINPAPGAALYYAPQTLN